MKTPKNNDVNVRIYRKTYKRAKIAAVKKGTTLKGYFEELVK